jgi:hypothetical protein
MSFRWLMYVRSRYQPNRAGSTAQSQRRTTCWPTTTAAPPSAAPPSIAEQVQAVAPRTLGRWRLRNEPCPCNLAGSSRCSRQKRSIPLARQRSGNRKAPGGRQTACACADDGPGVTALRVRGYAPISGVRVLSARPLVPARPRTGRRGCRTGQHAWPHRPAATAL